MGSDAKETDVTTQPRQPESSSSSAAAGGGLTPKAVNAIVRGEFDESNKPVVSLFPLSTSEVVVYDGKDAVLAKLLAPAVQQLHNIVKADSTRAKVIDLDPNLKEWYPKMMEITATILGTVVSEANNQGRLNAKPVVYLASFEKNNLKMYKSKRPRPLPPPHGQASYEDQDDTRVYGGSIANFFCGQVFSLTNEDFAGIHACGIDYYKGKTQPIKTCIKQYSAVQELNKLSSSAILFPNTTVYTSALRDFHIDQMERIVQSEELDGRKDESTTLQMALHHTGDFSLDVLKEWYLKLTGNALQTDEDLKKMCSSLQVLESRMVKHSYPASDQVLAAVTFAASVYLGIAFTNDGTHHLACIAANWALRRAGLPFPVNFGDLTCVIKMTLRNILLIKKGNVNDVSLLEAYRNSGALSPLIQKMLCSIVEAVQQFDEKVRAKLLAAEEDAETRVARKVREQSALGTCIICYNEKPEFSTLCCGTAIHYACIQKWLDSRRNNINKSCPQCRADISPTATADPIPVSDRAN